MVDVFEVDRGEGRLTWIRGVKIIPSGDFSAPPSYERSNETDRLRLSLTRSFADLVLG